MSRCVRRLARKKNEALLRAGVAAGYKSGQREPRLETQSHDSDRTGQGLNSVFSGRRGSYGVPRRAPVDQASPVDREDAEVRGRTVGRPLLLVQVLRWRHTRRAHESNQGGSSAAEAATLAAAGVASSDEEELRQQKQAGPHA